MIADCSTMWAMSDEHVDRDVRMHVFATAAQTGRVPQAPDIANALGETVERVRDSLVRLAAGKVLILAPSSTTIWAANPFCAVHAGFRVLARGVTYWGICIWDALGIVAALGTPDAEIDAPCGDCGEPLHLAFAAGELARAEGVIHFGVAARLWWENIGFA